MNKKLHILIVLFMAMSFIAQAQKESASIKSPKAIQTSFTPQYFAEIIAIENDEGMKVVVEISADYKAFIKDKAEIKRVVSLSKQQFGSILDALNFMSISGWSFVDQVLNKTDRSVERRILMSKSIATMEK